MNIVLVHGVLGAHIFAGKSYFNGVADHLRTLFGANVLESDAKPIGTVKVRSKELRADHADLVGHDVDDAPHFRPRAYDHLPLYTRIAQS